MGIFDESYSSVELAKILGVHRVTVTNWIKKGALKAVITPGGRYKITRKALKDFLQEHDMPIPPFLKINEKKLVVAVDDENAVLKLLKKFFSTKDMLYLYQLETFSNPLNAALFIGDKKPELVLMDLLMPKLDGFSLAEKIKQTSPDSRIIVITGYATEQNLKRLRKYKIDGLLTKPIDLKVLKRMVDDVLKLK